MGCGIDFVCETCKVSAYMGYGSYNTWLCDSSQETLESFDATWGKDDRFLLAKNQNFRDCLKEHGRHRWSTANWDFYHERKPDGALVAELGNHGADVVMIPDYSQYSHIDMTKDKS